MRNVVWLLVAIVSVVSPPLIYAQERIGLILSGGGARGTAHIGALKALHEHGIYPDAVAGTSMGAIVGGLYAAGYSVEQIEDIAVKMNWQNAFSDNSPRSHSLFAYRQMDAGAPVNYRLRINRNGISLPRAALQGQHLALILDELFFPVWSVDDFDQLRVPFRAVAADLVSGEQVVIRSGSVSSAVRASMSVPGLLEPVELDGRLLVDGGIASNIPIDALSEQNIDRLIVVDVGTPRWDKDDINSIGEVLTQLSALLVRNNSDKDLARLSDLDIVITPDLAEISNGDFSKAKQGIDAGYVAAKHVLTALGYARAEQTNEQRYLLQATEINPVIDEIIINNAGVVSDQVLRSMIRQELGAPLDRNKIREDISYIYALDYHDSVRFHIKNQHGRNQLYIEAEERETGNTVVKLGLQFSDDLEGNGRFGLFGSMRMAGLNRYGGTLGLLANLGSRPMLEARFFQPVDHTLTFFVEPLLGYRADSIDVYFNNDIDDPAAATFRRKEWYGGIDMGAALFRQKGEWRLGFQAKRGALDTKVNPIFPGEDYRDRYVFSRLSWDTYDNLAFPSKGVKALLEYQHHDDDFGASVNYQRQLVDLGVATTLAGFSIVAEASAALSEETPGAEAIEPLGGFLKLSGLPPDSIWGNHRVLGRLVFARPLRHNLILPSSAQIYAGMSYEVGNVWTEYSDVDVDALLSGGSVFLGTETPLGPGSISLGYTEGGHRAFNIQFGYLFR